MNKCKFLLSLVLSFSFLFGLFSVNAYASNNENLIDPDMNTWVDYSDITGVFEPLNISFNNGYNYITCSSTDRASAVYDLTNLIEVGEKYKFSVGIPTTDGVNALAFQNIEMTFSLVTVDDDLTVIDTVEDISFMINKNNYTSYIGKNFTFEFVLNKAVNRTALAISIVGTGDNGYHPYLQMYLVNPTLSRVETNEEGLLNSIIEWLKQIRENLNGGFSAIGENLRNGFENLKNNLIEVKNNIIQLPQKIGESIKNLFVPSDDYFENLSRSFKDIAEERFGALFTVVDTLDNFFESFDASKTTEYIDIPVYTFNIMGYPFSFGGWRFRFIPDFPVIKNIVNTIKGFTNILITFAFIEGLKSKYDEIFGGG